MGAGQGSPKAVFGFLYDGYLSDKDYLSTLLNASATYMNTVGTDGSGMRTSSACCLYCINRISEVSSCLSIARIWTYVEPNASNGSNLILRERRQDALDGLNISCVGSRLQDRSAGEDGDINLLAITQCFSNIDLMLNWLSNQDFRWVR